MKLLVDQKEIVALRELLDVTYPDLRVRYEALHTRFELVSTENHVLQAHLDEHNATIRHLSERNAAQHALILKMQQRLAELEPVRSTIPQPAFKK